MWWRFYYYYYLFKIYGWSLGGRHFVKVVEHKYYFTYAIYIYIRFIFSLFNVKTVTQRM